MKKFCTLLLAIITMLSLTACDGTSIIEKPGTNPQPQQPIVSQPYVKPTPTHSVAEGFDLNSIPEYSSNPVYIVNDNIPFFKEDEITSTSFEKYSPLDNLGRCRVAFACLGKDTMPPEGEKRGAIGMVKPTGWHTVKYPEVISDLYLYNRCHLIGWQLGNENANELNLTTGTRYLNVDGMLPYENQIADYIKSTGNHVMYRVAPIFADKELVCRGILMEAQSVEDDGCVFCVYCYNVQPGITINYANGESWLSTDSSHNGTNENTNVETTYIINTNTMKIHKPDCQYAQSISEKNRWDYTGLISDLLDDNYTICGSCKPE